MTTDFKAMRVTALAGGVGGAKLALGLQLVLEPHNLTVIVNTGDDFEHFGLAISPDVDTVCYSLAGIADAEHGWGLQGESWQVLSALEEISAPTWFQLGDRDSATHMERTRLLKAGWSLSQVTEHFCRLWGVPSQVRGCALASAANERSSLSDVDSHPNGRVAGFSGILCARTLRAGGS